jgi:hypothetical protein
MSDKPLLNKKERVISEIGNRLSNEIALGFKNFKDAIAKFTKDSKVYDNDPSESNKNILKADITTIKYTVGKLENNLIEYSKLNTSYDEKLKPYIRKLRTFRKHGFDKIDGELNKKTLPKFSYIEPKTKFVQNMRNNISRRKIVPYGTPEYISIPQFDMVLQEILPEESYEMIHKTAINTIATNSALNKVGSLFPNNTAGVGTLKGGKRRTHKRHNRRKSHTRKSHTRRN